MNKGTWTAPRRQDSEECDHEVRRLAHQGRDIVTRLDSEVGQSCRRTRGLLT